MRLQLISGNPPKHVSTSRSLLQCKALPAHFSVNMRTDCSRLLKREIRSSFALERTQNANFETVLHFQTNQFKETAKFAGISMARNQPFLHLGANLLLKCLVINSIKYRSIFQPLFTKMVKQMYVTIKTLFIP